MAVTRSMARAFSKDRLSALPDDLLLTHILPKISYKDVVNSSSLSRRWRFLWRKISILKFRPEDFEKQKDDNIHAIIKSALIHLDAPLYFWDIDLALEYPKAADLHNWICLAAEKQVRRIRLRNFYRDPETKLRVSNMVEIGDSIFRCGNLRALILKRVNFPKIPNNFRAFRYLKLFSCFGIPNMDDAMLEGFVDLCPHLRNLAIRGCFRLINLNICSSNLRYLSLGCLSRNFSLRIACPMLTEISLIDTDIKHCTGLKLLQVISSQESVKKISLQNCNARNSVQPGIPSITVLNRFPGLKDLTIHGLCFQEMISDEISVAEMKLPNLKRVRAHIGADKGEHTLNFLDFLLRIAPRSVIMIFLQEDNCPESMQNKLLDLEKEFTKSRLSTATRKWSMDSKQVCDFCGNIREY